MPPRQPLPLPANAENGDSSDDEVRALSCHCGGEVPHERPSGAVVCLQCGRPWQIVRIPQPRP